MTVRIQAAHGPVEVSLGEQEIRFRVAGRDVAILWSDIRGSGLARPPAVPTDLPRDEIELLPGRRQPFDIIPFGRRLVDLAGRVNATHRAVVIAHGGDRRGFQVFLPMQDEGTTRLLEELRSRLGERWLDGEWDLQELRKRLGIRFGWGGRLLGVGFVLVIGVGGFLAIAGWAGLKLAWEKGDFSLLQPLTLIPLAVWSVAVWYVLRRFRR